jgi:hypothetical protein
VELEILHLPRATRSYRFDELTMERLNKLAGRLGKTETEIVSAGVAHLLGTLERDQPIWMTAPSEGQKSHKKRSNAS